MSQYDKLDLVSIEILKLLSGYSLEEVQTIQKKVETQIYSTFHCILNDSSFEQLIENIKNEIT
ncbi:MAG: hypothetical protein ABI549_13330 [Flavobacterium sp.]|uniref:hypothetical protein n=1 Tax=Flavobacterium sp. TaxID=239 RepID=UPI003264D8B8